MATIASGRYSVGICARCACKVPYRTLRRDGNQPGLWVCRDTGCYDNINPYKKPARQADPVALDHPRPDVSIAVVPDIRIIPNMPQLSYITENGDYYTLEDGSGFYVYGDAP